MARFYMAVGIAGAGKSTVYAENYLYAEYVSSDAIREEVFGDVNDQEHNGEVFDIMLKRTREFLKAGADVFYDATNINAKRRINLLKELSHIPNVQKICVLVVPPFEVVKEQNAGRERQVPDYALDRMLRNFEVPHESEGWDEIVMYGNSLDNEYLEDELAKAMKISHDNHHHSETIGHHMVLAEDFIIKRKRQELKLNNRMPGAEFWWIQVAARYHDLGKPYCKVFHNARNEPTEEAHYYNHENVSAYMYLSHASDQWQSLYIANLIQHHMDHYKSGYVEKLAQRFDAEFMAHLALLNEADRAAH
jgi:predicted kinase